MSVSNARHALSSCIASPDTLLTSMILSPFLMGSSGCWAFHHCTGPGAMSSTRRAAPSCETSRPNSQPRFCMVMIRVAKVSTDSRGTERCSYPRTWQPASHSLLRDPMSFGNECARCLLPVPGVNGVVGTSMNVFFILLPPGNFDGDNCHDGNF